MLKSMHGERERDRMSGLLPIFRDVGTAQCQFTVLFFNFTPSTQPQHCHTTPLHLARRVRFRVRVRVRVSVRVSARFRLIAMAKARVGVRGGAHLGHRVLVGAVGDT